MVTVLALLVLVALIAGGTALAGWLGGDADPNANPHANPIATPIAGTAPSATAPEGPPTGLAPTAAPTPAATAEPSGTPEASVRADECDPEEVAVVAETDKEAYEPDESPILYLVVRNDGSEACTVNVGTSQMEFALTREDERVFSSVDCQQGSEDLERILQPSSAERATFEWSRNRTVPGCEVVDEEVARGSYTLTTRIGERSSDPITFTLR